ncbi:MAG: PASTA domain-containing protein [Actinomycetaceae bacterium]|nr:PASTA domain-containing protein [Actinomycetaceae bacterium]
MAKKGLARLGEHRWDLTIISVVLVLLTAWGVYVGVDRYRIEQSKIPTPDVKGMSLIDANRTLADAGFENAEIIETANGQYVAYHGEILTEKSEMFFVKGQVPKPGDLAAPRDGVVYVYVYRDPSKLHRNH